MKIELKSIVIGLIQDGELTTYSALLYIDGKPSAYTNGKLPGIDCDIIPLSQKGNELIATTEKQLSAENSNKSNTTNKGNNVSYFLAAEISKLAQNYLDNRLLKKIKKSNRPRIVLPTQARKRKL